MQEHFKFNLRVASQLRESLRTTSSPEPRARPCPLKVQRQSPPSRCWDRAGRSGAELPSRGAEEHSGGPGVAFQGSNGGRRRLLAPLPLGT